MEVPDDLIAEFVSDDNTDFWDLAVVLTILLEEAEKTTFNRSFSLENYSDEQCESYFRFTSDQITRLCHGLRIPATVTAPNRTSASGLEVLCIVLRRLSYPCRYVDLAMFFDRPRLE
ncbi:hypothetical protein BaRGS_00018786, partial [Batillaria attramentaria]